ncbi:MAG: hypothetical protein CMG18_05870 [Candidatus Marinimicrobia bacterium]|jgi:hypothetical protein|nr:hypothetical protein [Candidatus Neomarinimicrobiota bacterium]|tara:strand:+ start:2392 stop:2847 length:456 start_codon:yes stop_codon:yes gene_type:complete
MTKLWNDLKKNMKDWSSAAVEKAEEVSKIAVAKTEELTKVSKIKIEEHQFQRELSKLYEDMGRMVTKYAKDENMVNFSGNQEFFQIIENIEKIQLKIDKKIAEIKKIKEEYNITDVEVDNVIDKTNLDSQIEVEDVPAEINSDENQNSKKD